MSKSLTKPPAYDPTTDPYYHYTVDFGPVYGPQLSDKHIQVEEQEAKLLKIKQQYVDLHLEANKAKDRGELPMDPGASPQPEPDPGPILDRPDNSLPEGPPDLGTKPPDRPIKPPDSIKPPDPPDPVKPPSGWGSRFPRPK